MNYRRERVRKALEDSFNRPFKQLGSPKNLTESAKAKGKAVRVSNAIEESRQAAHVIENERAKGLPYHKVATKLNAMNYKTRRGGQFSATQVQRIEKRIKQGLYENVK